LLLPAIRAGPRPAYTTHCLSNLRQINIAIHMYVEDWGHDAAGSTNNFTSPFLSWTDYRPLIADYVGIKNPPSPTDHVFACPKDTFYYALSSKDPPVTHAPLHTQSNYLFTSYAYNAGMVTTRPTTNSLGTIRVTAPDGRVFVASIPTGRVQRYGPGGFERGFFVDSRGGYFDFGLSLSGDIMICSGRGAALVTYDRDGLEIGERKPCTRDYKSSGLLPSPYHVSHAEVPAIASSWLAAVAVPLWHPFVAWLISAVSMVVLVVSFKAWQEVYG